MVRDWLKESRLERGMTMAEIAKRLDLTESYYSRIESGERQKKMDILLAHRLSEVLGIPVQTIMEKETA